MARIAFQLTMFGIQKRPGNINLFIGLQRSQGSPSSFARDLLGRGRFAFNFLDFPSQPDEPLDIGVTLDTFIFAYGFSGGQGFIRKGRDSQK